MMLHGLPGLRRDSALVRSVACPLRRIFLKPLRILGFGVVSPLLCMEVCESVLHLIHLRFRTLILHVLVWRQRPRGQPVHSLQGQGATNPPLPLLVCFRRLSMGVRRRALAM